MLVFSTGKTGSLNRGSTSGSGWTAVTLYDLGGTAVSTSNPQTVDQIDFANVGSGTGDAWVRINGNTGAAIFVPAGSSFSESKTIIVTSIEIIRDASTNLAGFAIMGQRRG